MSRLTNDVNYYTGLSASADGKKIVVTQGQRFDDIWVWQVNGQEPAAKITNRSVTIDTLAWMADGHIMYNESENGKHTLWNINRVDRSRARVTADEIQGNSPDVSPDGQNIVFRSNRSGTWQLWMMRSDGTELRKISSDDQVIGRAAFALGGKKLIVERSVDDVERLALMDPDGSSVTDVSPPFVGQWAVGPDGMTIAYRFYDQLVGRTRTAVQSLVDPSKISYIEIIPRDFLVFDPGGDVVLTKRAEPEFDPMSTIWAYPIAGGPPSKFFSNPPDNIYSIRFSKDGKQMAAIAGHTATNLVLFSRSD
jgi:Tol biopolymer transport system component